MSEAPVIDATLYIRRDGATWEEPHWITAQNIDDPMPRYRIVEIKDGTNEPPPWAVYLLPNRA